MFGNDERKTSLEEVQDHIEETLEKWMELNVQRHLEETLVHHLTSISKMVVDYEKRHSRRWKWLVVGIGTALTMNIMLVVVIFHLLSLLYA